MHTQALPIKLPADLLRVLFETSELKRAFLVGGCVRDALLGKSIKDYDIEVYGLTYEELESVLGRWGRTDHVGRSYGVIKLKIGRETFDFTVPRRDSKIAPGHKGFDVELCPDIDPRDAAARRDFTVNSLMWDPRSSQVIDHFKGIQDLQHRILRHTSAAFPEDPLRVLRGMQFASRFGLTPAPETVGLSREIRAAQKELAVERIREEWMKWASKSVIPSAGLKFLRDSGWLEFYPELFAMIDTPQEPEWHPEGDVWVHTGHCCDALANLPAWQNTDEESRIVQMLAVLTHDIGKPSTTTREDRRGTMRIVSPMHDEAGVKVADAFFERIQLPLALRKRIAPLIANHMVHLTGISDRGVRRLSKRLEPENIATLCQVMLADNFGRPPLPHIVPATVNELLAKAEELHVKESAPKPLLLGRHLLELGLLPGKRIGQLLEIIYEAQLEGKFYSQEEALKWLQELPEYRDMRP